MIYDWRSHQLPAGPPGRKPAGKVVNGKLVVRDPKSIDALCLHQMAVTLGASVLVLLVGGAGLFAMSVVADEQARLKFAARTDETKPVIRDA